MAGPLFGFGQAARSRFLHAVHGAAPVQLVPQLQPAAAWSGVAGSGFVSPPVNPARTTAKPACRLLIPDRQAFTNQILVGVYAGANNGGSLLQTLGLSKVVFHYEGQSAEVTAPSYQTFNDANGQAVTYLGWWCWLQHSGTNGQAQLYVEAVPRDSTMQKRVIGPHVFLPSPALYDFDLTVAPSQPEIAGTRYQSVGNALNYLRLQSAQHPRITITEARSDYTLGSIIPYTGAAGRCVIEASVPATFALTSGTKGGMRPRYGNLHLRGGNITFDMRYITNLQLDEGVTATSPTPVLDGVHFINSGGRGEYWDKGPRPTGWVVRGGPWFLECTFDNTSNTCLSATAATNLVRGCVGTVLTGDCVTGVSCVIGSRFDDCDSSAFKNDLNAMTVSYTGAAASATLALSGTNDAATRTFTAKAGGTSVGTYTVVNNNPAGNYDVADVVAWLNTLPGWTATLLDDSRRATALGLVGGAGTGFGDTDVKSAPLTLMTQFDIHPDWFQDGALDENCVLVDNVALNLTGQELFITQTARDFLVINNVFHRKPGNTAYFSQFFGTHSHVVVAHNSWTDQDLWLKDSSAYNPDTYSLIANNAFASISLMTADADLVVKGNHFASGATVRGTDGSVGGTKSSLYVAADAGNFTPAGALLAANKVPVVQHGPGGGSRGGYAPAGAWVP